jgi:hypothetical protein
LAGLTADPLVESLLLLHGLHPLDVDARIQRALERVRPNLGSHAGGVRYLGVTDGVARVHTTPVSSALVIAAALSSLNAYPALSAVRALGAEHLPQPRPAHHVFW